MKSFAIRRHCFFIVNISAILLLFYYLHIYSNSHGPLRNFISLFTSQLFSINLYLYSYVYFLLLFLECGHLFRQFLSDILLFLHSELLHIDQVLLEINCPRVNLVCLKKAYFVSSRVACSCCGYFLILQFDNGRAIYSLIVQFSILVILTKQKHIEVFFLLLLEDLDMYKILDDIYTKYTFFDILSKLFLFLLVNLSINQLGYTIFYVSYIFILKSLNW